MKTWKLDIKWYWLIACRAVIKQSIDRIRKMQEADRYSGEISAEGTPEQNKMLWDVRSMLISHDESSLIFFPVLKGFLITPFYSCKTEWVSGDRGRENLTQLLPYTFRSTLFSGADSNRCLQHYYIYSIVIYFYCIPCQMGKLWGERIPQNEYTGGMNTEERMAVVNFTTEENKKSIRTWKEKCVLLSTGCHRICCLLPLLVSISQLHPCQFKFMDWVDVELLDIERCHREKVCFALVVYPYFHFVHSLHPVTELVSLSSHSTPGIWTFYCVHGTIQWEVPWSRYSWIKRGQNSKYHPGTIWL